MTEHGVGGLQLGRPLGDVRQDALVGPAKPGCELNGPAWYWTTLRPPLTGTAQFGGSEARLRQISVTRGAVTDHGVGIGASAARVLEAYPEAHADNSQPDDPLQFHAIVLSRDHSDRLWFLLDRKGGHVTSFELPGPAFCE